MVESGCAKWAQGVPLTVAGFYRLVTWKTWNNLNLSALGHQWRQWPAGPNPESGSLQYMSDFNVSYKWLCQCSGNYKEDRRTRGLPVEESQRTRP
jgi:hypothetical protein